MNITSQSGGLPPHAIPVQAPHCVVRSQQEGYLFYNPHTDEMHLVPAAGYALYAQCDGVRTVADIQHWTMPDQCADRAGAADAVVRFLAALAARGLVEVHDADQ